MNSDHHFHEIFQTHPEWLFDLLGKPVPANCKFTSPVAKAVQRQLDGFLTADGWPPTVVEFQMWPENVIYPRVGMELAQAAMQVYPQVPVAYIIFASANLDDRTEPWCQFIRAIYLDEQMRRLARDHPDHLLLSVLFPLLEQDDSKLVAEGQMHYNRVQTSLEAPKDRDVLLRILTDFLFQRLPQYTHAQLTKMMKLTPLEETEGYKSLIRDAMEKGLSQGISQGRSEGLSNALIRQAHHRFPKTDKAIDEAIGDLDYLSLERLADAMLDFPDLQSLLDWLDRVR